LFPPLPPLSFLCSTPRGDLSFWGHSERTNNEWSAIADKSTAHVAYISGIRPVIIPDFEETQKCLPRDENEDRETDHILRIFWAYDAVTTSTTVPARCEKAGFTYQKRNGIVYLVVQMRKIRRAPDFQET
jgi:hypothetical protein